MIIFFFRASLYKNTGKAKQQRRGRFISEKKKEKGKKAVLP
ncbi:MAG: hypothetical protein AVDCRST_MAG96-1530 [uncultured Segetibacter sp.]|uniref:Uncharacterized protein n=1 Tax=uncultured Segetibacter sp. TaxID=481133 RepID=A0A6J4S7E0_9BACT|nr:MAG: hypothetical protein AVDCRST_MAG96-1530 [uncultured Segetibacter sp.]